MAFEIGQIVEGKVTRIMNYGAFVDLGNGTSGMVHISEVAPTYVKEITDHLSVGQEVKVKILSIDERGKISLSIKQAMPRQQNGSDSEGGFGRRGGGRRGGGSGNNSGNGGARIRYSGNSEGYERNGGRQNRSDNFDDMLSRFMASSDEKISELKKDNRRSRKGGNNGGGSR